MKGFTFGRHPELTLFPLSVTPEGCNPESSHRISGSNKQGFTLFYLNRIVSCRINYRHIVFGGAATVHKSGGKEPDGWRVEQTGDDEPSLSGISFGSRILYV